MPILMFLTGENQTSQPQSPVAKPVAFDIVLGQNDSEKPSPLMPNRPPRRLKVVPILHQFSLIISKN